MSWVEKERGEIEKYGRLQMFLVDGHLKKNR